MIDKTIQALYKAIRIVDSSNHFLNHIEDVAITEAYEAYDTSQEELLKPRLAILDQVLNECQFLDEDYEGTPPDKSDADREFTLWSGLVTSKVLAARWASTEGVPERRRDYLIQAMACLMNVIEAYDRREAQQHEEIAQ